MMAAALSIDGKLVEIDGLHLSALDRGFLLGDGLFETMRATRNRVIRLERHLARLRHGASILDLKVGWSNQEIVDIVKQTLEAGSLEAAVVRLTVSRGVSANRGLLPTDNPRPTLAVLAAPFAGYPDEMYRSGMRTIISPFPRNERSPIVKIKTLNYLEQVLARQQANRQGADEAIILNTRGNVAGASAANLFIVDRGRVSTPTLECGALAGTVRQALLDHLPDRVCERPITTAELYNAEEVFLTNALLGVMPVTEIESRPIASGKAGPTTKEIGQILLELSEEG